MRLGTKTSKKDGEAEDIPPSESPDDADPEAPEWVYLAEPDCEAVETTTSAVFDCDLKPLPPRDQRKTFRAEWRVEGVEPSPAVTLRSEFAATFALGKNDVANARVVATIIDGDRKVHTSSKRVDAFARRPEDTRTESAFTSALSPAETYMHRKVTIGAVVYNGSSREKSVQLQAGLVNACGKSGGEAAAIEWAGETFFGVARIDEASKRLVLPPGTAVGLSGSASAPIREPCCLEIFHDSGVKAGQVVDDVFVASDSSGGAVFTGPTRAQLPPGGSAVFRLKHQFGGRAILVGSMTSTAPLSELQSTVLVTHENVVRRGPLFPPAAP